MGFFNSLAKLAKGEPVFDKPQDDGWQGPAQDPFDDPTQQPAQNIPPNDPAPVEQNIPEDETEQPKVQTAQGYKAIPKVAIIHNTYKLHDTGMDVYAYLKNFSDGVVTLDKARMLNLVRELDNVLRPGEERQFLVYSGPRPSGTHDTKAEIIYRSAAGDYFDAEHLMTFHQEHDGTYSINEFRPYPYI